MIVWECRTDFPGYTPWQFVHVIYLMMFLVRTTFLAVKTRNIPSGFNESSQLLYAMLILVFCAIMLIPLDALVSDDPDSAKLVRGVGQAFVSAILLLTLYVPKIYYIFRGGELGGSIYQTVQLKQSVQEVFPSSPWSLVPYVSCQGTPPDPNTTRPGRQPNKSSLSSPRFVETC
jgi:hypothetical protein